jgi:hypothetical protein
VKRAVEFLVSVRRPTVEPRFWWVRYNSISPCAQMAADGALQPVADHAADGRRCPNPAVAPKRDRRAQEGDKPDIASRAARKPSAVSSTEDEISPAATTTDIYSTG